MRICMYMNMCKCIYQKKYSKFPKLALANGVLTALYKGPCSVAGCAANAVGNIWS